MLPLLQQFFRFLQQDLHPSVDHHYHHQTTTSKRDNAPAGREDSGHACWPRRASGCRQPGRARGCGGRPSQATASARVYTGLYSQSVSLFSLFNGINRTYKAGWRAMAAAVMSMASEVFFFFVFSSSSCDLLQVVRLTSSLEHGYSGFVRIVEPKT